MKIIKNLFTLLLLSLYSIPSFCSEGFALSPTMGFSAMPESMPLYESIAMVEWFETKKPLVFVGKKEELSRWHMIVNGISNEDSIKRTYLNPRLNGIRFECDHVTMYMSLNSGGDESTWLSVHPQTVQFLQNACLQTDNITFICDNIKKNRDKSQIHNTHLPVVTEEHKYVINALVFYDTMLHFLHQKKDGDLPECYKKEITPYELDLAVTEQEVCAMNDRLHTGQDLIFEVVGIGSNRRWKMASDEKAPAFCKIITRENQISLSYDDTGNIIVTLCCLDPIRLEPSIYYFLRDQACNAKDTIFFIDMLECDKYYQVSPDLLLKCLRIFSANTRQ